MDFHVTGNLVDILSKTIYFAEVTVGDGTIKKVRKIPESAETAPYIIPGFIDAHVHIESSMLPPAEFARLAVVHGTVATVSDPHEIANVCGLRGVDFMISNGSRVPFKFYFGAPSCVPATVFETAGAALPAGEVDALLARKEIHYLSEMMNFPGVLNGNVDVTEKIASAKKYNKPVDGHAPGLRGGLAKRYIEAGISTDHECFTREEALDKLKYGMKILIREGSAAKNFEALIGLLNDYPEKIMFCSDDKHPDSLVSGHINQLCSRAVAKGIDVFNVLRAACINPIEHYAMETGMLREGDPADFVIVEDLRGFKVLETYINGELVAREGKTNIISQKAAAINHFDCYKKQVSDFRFSLAGSGQEVLAIEALDGQLITNKVAHNAKIVNDVLVSDLENDILKMVVVNRYKTAPIAMAFVKNFGLKKGAIASSVAHDSHNIIAVGVNDESMCKAVNIIIEAKGGISCVSDPGAALPDQEELVLPLPLAGLMSNGDGYEVAEMYTKLDKVAKSMGCRLSSPFMTLSFMALLVIPHLKLSDLGLFDGDKFELITP